MRGVTLAAEIPAGHRSEGDEGYVRAHAVCSREVEPVAARSPRIYTLFGYCLYFVCKFPCECFTPLKAECSSPMESGGVCNKIDLS